MKWNITVTPEYKIKFSSEYARETFKEYLNKDKTSEFSLSPHKKISREARGYFEGGLIPAFAEYSEFLDRNNKEDLKAVRISLKREYLFGITKNVFTNEPIKYVKSTANLNRKEFSEFVERVVNGFAEQGIPVPDPELYKEYQDCYSMDFKTFYDYLDFLKIRCDKSPLINK